MNSAGRPEHRPAAIACGLADPDLQTTLQDVHHLAAVGVRDDGRIVYWNRGAERFFGHAADQALAANLQDLMRTDGQRVWARSILNPSSPLPTHRTTLPGIGGASTACLVSASRVADCGSEAIYLLITPLELPAAMAAASPQPPAPPCDEALGVLAGGIAHDFNNLLLGMMGNADLLLMELPVDHAAREHVDQITQAGLRAADLCRQLMAFSGSTMILKESVDINDLIRHLVPLARMSLGAVPLTLELAADLPPVDGDATQLRQICLNLLTNAAEAIAGRHDGTVEIRTRLRTHQDRPAAGTDQPGRGFLLIEVHDNGVGMIPEQVERAFDPFYTTKFLGRGLGLAAAQGIVRSHGGAIDLCSSSGAGTTVTVTLPASSHRPATAAASPMAPTAQIPGSGHRILVVDDEAHVRAVTSGMLRRAGNTVTLAEHGGEALAILADDPSTFDLVLLDMTMPGLSGVDTLERIRELRPDLPVLLSSGYGPEQSAHLVSQDSRCSFLAKPYRRQQLLSAIGALLTGE
jgi:nitrogen-specific signal transduction histidine kinase/ActR/RegA family two-component response regulator